MKLEIVMVTPEMAEALLETNAVNRPVSQQRVERLAQDMRAGLWQMNGATITVSESGRLLDGQHRLYAIREAGMPVQMIVVTGPANTAFETIDTGRSRQASDIAAMRGIEYPLVSAAVAGMLWRLWNNAPMTEACPPATMLRVLERWPEIQQWAPLVDRLGKERTAPSSAYTMACVYLAGIAKKSLLADRFFHGLSSGADLASGNPLLTLRNRLLSMRISGQVMSSITCWAMITRTLTAMEGSETLLKIVDSGNRGPIKRPDLWDEHVAVLPVHKRLNDLPGPITQSSQQRREVFKSMVKEHKDRANDTHA